jgi:hypothetical protein
MAHAIPYSVAEAYLQFLKEQVEEAKREAKQGTGQVKQFNSNSNSNGHEQL